MSRKKLLGYVVLPMIGFAGYFISLAYFPQFTKSYIHTEHGAIEWGTAISFFAAGCFAGRLAWKTPHLAPARYRVFYGLFALAGCLVALEEISYGQKLFDWNSPVWFTAYNAKRETNLHNMLGSKPSDLLRAVATVGWPVCCGLIPVWLARRGYSSRPGSGPFYLLPGLELVTLCALTLVLTVFNKIPSIKGMATWTGHLGEFKELCWGICALGYIAILSRRVLSGSAGPACSVVSPDAGRRAA